MEVNNARFDENSDESPVDAQKSEDHKKLLEYGIHESVADRLDEIYKSGKDRVKIIHLSTVVISRADKTK